MRRVLVIGSGGAGKTTLARRIAERTGLPLIHLDMLFWHPGWVPTPKDEWHRLTEELVARDAWVMDGNYGSTMARRLDACDTVIFLDMPRLLCLWRVIKRRRQHAGRNRDSLPEGCPETVNLEFLRWIWTYPKRRRGEILRRLETLKGRVHVVILRDDAAVDNFVAGLPARSP